MADLVLSAQIAVVGGGPAGIAAATRAAEAGADVLLIDDGVSPGGQIWKSRGGESSLPSGARRWIERLHRARARILPSAQVVFAERGYLRAEDVGSGGRAIEVRAPRLVLATGARERFLPFPGWTLPNVIGVGAAQSLVKSGARVKGRRVVVAGSGPLLLAAAASLSEHGARIVAVAEQASRAALAAFALGLWRRPGRLAAAALYRKQFFGSPYRAGTWVARARGGHSVEQVDLTDGRSARTVDCDLLCCGYGLVANVEIARSLDCQVGRDHVVVDEFQRASVSEIFCAGEAAGIGGVDLALLEGEIAGLAAAEQLAAARELFSRRAREASFAKSLAKAFSLRPELASLAEPDTVVCRCEDVALRLFDRSWTARQGKLYTRAGMGPCQGRVCGPALEFLFGWSADSVRPPLRPSPLSIFGGDDPNTERVMPT